jgi:hypothetical protein
MNYSIRNKTNKNTGIPDDLSPIHEEISFTKKTSM